MGQLLLQVTVATFASDGLSIDLCAPRLLPCQCDQSTKYARITTRYCGHWTDHAARRLNHDGAERRTVD